MIKSVENLKKFTKTCESLNKKFIKLQSFFDEKFLDQIQDIFHNFEKFSLNDLENKIDFLKTYKNNIENFDCDLKTKDKCQAFIDDCLFFINDLIMNEIIENI